MADPLTILGGLAATAQLAEQLIKVSGLIYELCNNIQQAAKIIGSRILAVNRLITIARLIMTNAALQNDAVALILRSCLDTAGMIQRMLEKMKGSRMKAFLIMSKEKETLRLFDELEKDKTTLILCLQEANIRITGIAKDELIGRLERPGENLPEVESRYYDVPNRRVRSFVGREKILGMIQELFLVPGPSTQIVVLRAMGGQGKTQIALEMCRQMKDICWAIFWIDASSESSLKKAFGHIFEKIRPAELILVDADSKATYVQKRFCEWCRPWLMVFDNYDDPEGFNNIQDFIPESSLGRILVTSRHAATLSLADDMGRIELPGLDPKDAVELLVRQSAPQGDRYADQAASTIVERLGYHALAVDQAGSYIHKRSISFQEFLVDYESRRKIILQEVPRMSQYRRKVSEAEQEIPLNVLTTCELSFRQLEANDNGRQKGQLLTFLAFFHCAPFSELILREFWASPLRLAWLPETSCFLAECLSLSANWDSDIFVDCLIQLRDLSLIQSFDKQQNGYCSLTLHPLVQEWLTLRIDHAACMQYSLWTTNVLMYSANNFYSDIAPYFTKHIQNCNRFVQPAAVKGDDVAEWVYANVLFSKFLNRPDLVYDAERTIEKALCAIDQTDQSGTSAYVLRLKQRLAIIWDKQGRRREAEVLYKQNRRDMRNLDPEAAFVVRGPDSYSEDDLQPTIKGFSKQMPLSNLEKSHDMYQHDSLNGLYWALTSQGRLLEAGAVMEEARDLMMRMVHPEKLQNLVWLRKAAEKFGWTDNTLELMDEPEGWLSHRHENADFFHALARAIKTPCRGPKTESMMLNLVKSHLQVLSGRYRPGMVTHQLLDVLLNITADEAQNISIPEIIYKRETPDTYSDAETLEIYSLLTEVLLRLGRFQEAKDVALGATGQAEGYKALHNMEPRSAMQCQLRFAMAVPLPDVPDDDEG